MNRRELLALTGASLSAGLAGCSGDDASSEPSGDGEPAEPGTDGGDESGGSDGSSEEANGSRSSISGDPLSTVDAYVGALDDSDGEAAIALLHERNRLGPGNLERNVSFYQGADVTLVERAIITTDEMEGELEVVTRGIIEVDRGEETSRVGLELRVRRSADGEWRITDGGRRWLVPDDSPRDGGSESVDEDDAAA